MSIQPDSTTVAAWVCVFVLSGVAGPLLLTQARYSYSPAPATLWPLLPYYLGNAIAGIFAQPISKANWLHASQLFGLDGVGQILTNLGLIAIGPPLFSIFYKSVTLFTGLLAMIFLPPPSQPTRWQWGAMVTITLGLALEGFDTDSGFGMSAIAGASMVMTGCLFFAGSAVASESFLTSRNQVLHPMQAAWALGIEGTTAWLVWYLASGKQLPSDAGFIGLLAVMVLSSACHQATWFLLVGRMGACATAVLKAVQSVILFAAASAAFCHLDRLECFSWAKGCSFAVVVAGVLLYAVPLASVGAEAEPFAKRRGRDERP